MPVVNAKDMTTKALEEFDAMMFECVVKVQKFAGLATAVWSDVLKELEARGRIRLISGSYDDVGNALIERVVPADDSH